jgi:hypothetical protein
VLELILKEQHIISNLLLIKGMLLLKSIMDYVYMRVKVFKLMVTDKPIISNLLLITDMLLLNSIMGIV